MREKCRNTGFQRVRPAGFQPAEKAHQTVWPNRQDACRPHTLEACVPPAAAHLNCIVPAESYALLLLRGVGTLFLDRDLRGCEARDRHAEGRRQSRGNGEQLT